MVESSDKNIKHQRKNVKRAVLKFYTVDSSDNKIKHNRKKMWLAVRGPRCGALHPTKLRLHIAWTMGTRLILQLQEVCIQYTTVYMNRVLSRAPDKSQKLPGHGYPSR